MHLLAIPIVAGLGLRTLYLIGKIVHRSLKMHKLKKQHGGVVWEVDRWRYYRRSRIRAINRLAGWATATIIAAMYLAYTV